MKVTRVSYPSPVVTPYAADNLIVAYLFSPDGPGPHPVMLVLHEWLPNNLKDEFDVATALAKSQIAALVMVEPFSLDRRPIPHVPEAELLSDNVPQMVAGIRQCVLDARRSMDWLATRPDIDANKMGISGISLGGVIAPLVAGVDRRAKIVVAIDGGADVTELVWSSPFLRNIHEKLVRHGFTKQSVRAQLAPIESSNWLSGFDPHNGILFNGRYDVFVKPSQARELSHAMGDAPIVWLNTGHYGLVFSLKALNSAGVDFVKSRFMAGTAAYTPPATLPSKTIKLGLLIGGHEGVSPDLALQVLNFDKAGRYSIDGQLTLHGISGALSGRLTNTSSVGLEFPFFHGPIKPRPFVLLHIVL